MNRIQEFEYIFADNSGVNNCFFNTEEDYLNEFDDCADNCVIWNHINFYGAPYGTSDSKFERMEEGNFSDTIKIGEIIGFVILCKQIVKEGFDPVEICDDVNQDLEYTLSAMSDKQGPFNTEEYQDIYYIHDFKMENEYNNAKFKNQIITQLPKIVFQLFHIEPSFLTFYPLPLKYTPDPKEEAKYDFLQKVAAQKVDLALGYNENQDEKFIKFANEYQFSDDELKMIMRRRVHGSSYPQKAKDKKEFDFYISNGFKEVGNSRLLCKEV